MLFIPCTGVYFAVGYRFAAFVVSVFAAVYILALIFGREQMDYYAASPEDNTPTASFFVNLGELVSVDLMRQAKLA